MKQTPTARDILILGLIALLTGAFIGLAAFVGAILAGWSKPWAYGLGGWSVVSALTWLSLLAWSGRLIQAVNGMQAEQIETHQNYDLTIRYNDHQAGDFIGLESIKITPTRFYKFLEGVASGKPLGENYWTGNGALFSKGEYHRLRDLLCRRGYIQQKGRHHASGFELTEKGGALIAKFSKRNAKTNQQPTRRVIAPGYDNLPEMRLGENARAELDIDY